LNFKEVLDAVGEREGEYEPGKHRYPDYEVKGIPETFVIKKTPDLVIADSDIESIEVKTDRYSSPKPAWSVRVRLFEGASERMRVFSESNLKKRVAIEVDGVIVQIPTVQGVLTNEIGLTFVSVPLSEIETTLKKVTHKIRTEEP
jgi:preprotein translocase subunit SecD